MRRGFTLVELLVVVSVIAVLMGVLLPSLGAARDSARSARCAANLKQLAIACVAYAGENDGRTPALGQPYSAWPNWAMVVQTYSERAGTGAALFSRGSGSSALVCPSTESLLGRPMQRTYAINATGHAGQPGDRGDYDSPARSAHIRLHNVKRASETPMLLDSAVPPSGTVTGAPPPTRTASVLDFRQPAHVADRLGRPHGRRGGGDQRMNMARFDASVGAGAVVEPWWLDPLP